ncbi:hypothetical protein EJ04DRAFT_517575 [Polyplosphaeria fusca]|uniref:Uncharacterized protein n=1 Tax=Polyplosphaeria fusca TaxID=682080 RepID=A0A9P4QI73_9PLEO|nr:hypothetical protein EJ04DRAFT_517575 [Polyplosphaeria fusca]
MERPRRINAGKRRAEREDEAPKNLGDQRPRTRSQVDPSCCCQTLQSTTQSPTTSRYLRRPPYTTRRWYVARPSRPPPRRHLRPGPLQPIDGNTRRVQLPDSFNGGPIVYTEPDSCSYEDIENIL